MRRLRFPAHRRPHELRSCTSPAARATRPTRRWSAHCGTRPTALGSIYRAGIPRRCGRMLSWRKAGRLFELMGAVAHGSDPSRWGGADGAHWC
jgi:hypothetical protein